ncbi:MAG: hypothetical protein JXB62_14120 [Pirellulales bacterium]|nr:hypothetical protein [Pirellulales bacterium]
MSDYGVSTQNVVFAGLLSAILTVAAIIGLEVVYRHYEAGLEAAKSLDGRPAELEALLARQESQLADYRPVDDEKGIVSIPIQRAMELVVAQWSRPQAAAANGPKTEEEHDEP